MKKPTIAPLAVLLLGGSTSRASAFTPLKIPSSATHRRATTAGPLAVSTLDQSIVDADSTATASQTLTTTEPSSPQAPPDLLQSNGIRGGIATAVGVATAVYLTINHNVPFVVDAHAAQHHHAISAMQHVATDTILQVWNSYEAILTEHRIATKAATSATVYGIGDVVSQRTESNNNEEESSTDLDTGRILRSMIAGGVGHGPMSHFWYNFCEEFFHNIVHLNGQWWDFIPKIVVDQTVFGPIWNASYILLLGLMQRENWTKLMKDVQTSTLPLMVQGLKLWPLVHCVTYGLIPVENRLLWVDFVEILWVSMLATQAASLKKETTTTTNTTMPSSSQKETEATTTAAAAATITL